MRIKGLCLACVKKLTKAGLAASFNNHLSDSAPIFVAHNALDSNEPQTQLLLSSRGRDISRLSISPPVSRIGMLDIIELCLVTPSICGEACDAPLFICYPWSLINPDTSCFGRYKPQTTEIGGVMRLDPSTDRSSL